MALENPTHIHQLVPTNPTPTDPASQGDDHIRAIKRTIKNTFPNITGRIDATQAQLNYTTGLTGNIQTQLDKITGTNLTVGPGLKGGGTLSQNRSISLDFGPLPVMSEDASHPRLIAIEGADSNTLSRASPFTLRRDFDLAKGTSKITTGPGLSGGGDLTGDRQIDLDFGSLPANRDPTLPRLIAMDGVDSGSTYRITPAALRTTFDLAPGSVTINAGSGLSGGGDLSANRTLSVDGTVVRNSRTINAGSGLSGGGDLSTNRTLSVDGTVVRNSRTINTGLGLSGGGNMAADRTISLDLGSLPYSAEPPATSARIVALSGADNATAVRIPPSALRALASVPPTTTTITAGSGLSGGGDLSSNRTISLGTPTAITATSTNSVSETGHTHSLSSFAVRTLLSEADQGLVGTYVLAATNLADYSVSAFGDVVAGSHLRPACVAGVSYSDAKPLSGSWRCMGNSRNAAGWSNFGGGGRTSETTLWLRIA